MTPCSRCDAGIVHPAHTCDWWLSEHPEQNTAAAQIHRLTARGHKYRAIRSVYRREVYDSKAEAEWAAELERRLRGSAIRAWSRARTYVLQETPRITYRPDFEVIPWACKGAAGYFVVDVKGVQTQAWKLKAKLFTALYPDIPLAIVTNGRESVYGEKQPRKKRKAAA